MDNMRLGEELPGGEGDGTDGTKRKGEELNTAAKKAKNLNEVNLDEITQVLQCPPDKVGQIIGSKGMVVLDIQKKSCAKVLINQNFPEGVPRQISITGNDYQVKAAVDLIRLIIAEGPTAIHENSLIGGPSITSTLECTQPQVGKVIGAGGATIKDIQSKSGAKIQLEQNFPDGVNRKIHISGTQAAVSDAIKLVQSVLESDHSHIGGMQQSNIAGTGPGHMMNIPKSVVGKILGRGGETVQNIQRRSGCRITIDQSMDPCKLSITGAAQGIRTAHSLISDIMMEMGVQRPPALMGHNGPQNQFGQQNPYHDPRGFGQQPMGGHYSMSPHMMPHGGHGMSQQQFGGMPPNYPVYMGAGGQHSMPPSMPYPGSHSSMQGYQNQEFQDPRGQANPQHQHQHHNHNHYQSHSSGLGPTSASQFGGPTQLQTPPQIIVPPVSIPSKWVEHKTDQGLSYWYDSSTGKSQWERPNM